ncbi:MAG: lytic transglycosylase domain-containing protein, partial [Chloroflexota bacterium]
ASFLLAFGLSRVQINTDNVKDLSFSGAGAKNAAARQASEIAPFFTPEVQRWGEKITIWSQRWGMDPNLIATVMQIESCGNPKALSGAGAMGLFQVMPYHFAVDDDPFKPVTNAERGLNYLKNALDTRDGDYRLAFAGYNGGINGAKQPENAWPAETQRYVYWGTGIYEEAKKGASSSRRLNEWLSNGGASLCAQAAQVLGLNP